MTNEQTIDFLKLVKKTIQTDYQYVGDAREAMYKLLEETDRIHLELTGSPLVDRGHTTVTEAIVGIQKMRVPREQP